MVYKPLHMGSDDWVSVGEFRDELSVGVAAQQLSSANISTRVWRPPWSDGQTFIWVPPECEKEARRILAESAVPAKELADQALAYPRPDDADPTVATDSTTAAPPKASQSTAKAVGCVVALLFSILVVGGLWIGNLSRLAHCRNVLLWEVPSPDGYLKASVFRTECVDATPTVGVSLLESSQWVEPTFRANLLRSVAHPELLHIRWDKPRTLVISYPGSEHPTKLWRNWVATEYGRVDVLMEPE